MGWKAEVRRATTTEELRSLIESAETEGWSALIVQMPVAPGIEFDYSWIPRHMDADGLAPASPVMPATVRGIIDYLDACGFEYKGKNAVILGRSHIVGRPMAKALLDRDMTVSVCHSKTALATRLDLTKDADLVISAVGKTVITRESCPHAIVVDVGIHRNMAGTLQGDFVEIEEIAKETGAWSTPVPGGVGLLTRLGLMKNCVDLV